MNTIVFSYFSPFFLGEASGHVCYLSSLSTATPAFG